MHQLEQVYDAAVIGAGLSGLAAAVELRKAGHSVLIVERRPVLAWEATWAFRLDADSLSTPLSPEIVSKLEASGGMRNGRIDAPILQILLDEYVKDKGIDILLYSHPVAVQADNGLASSVTIATKSGQCSVRAKAFVDATDNGLLWRQTGVEFSEPEQNEAVHAVFLNDANPLEETRRIKADTTDIEAKSTVWDGEIALEFTITDSDVRTARRAIPDVLTAARNQMSELDGAVVTHVGVEPFPLSASRPDTEGSAAHPSIKNLFGAGRWSDTDTGREIADLITSLPEPKPTDVAEGTLAVPPAHSCDVLVCGGGTAGAFAAIAAGRQGVKTMLIEPTTFLGGQGTGGGIHLYYHGVKGGIQDEADARIEDILPLFGSKKQVMGFHPQAKKVVLQQMADEAGVEIVFNTIVNGVETEDVPSKLPATGKEQTARRITGVMTAGPDGSALYQAKAVIDSTGDGDVAVMAGAPYTFGRETDNLPHAYSLASGRLGEEANLLLTNFDAGYCDPTDVVDLTRALRRGLEHYRNEKYTEEDRLVYIAPLIGIRNSRQILGDYVLTMPDEIAGRDFPDVIAYAHSNFDNHGADYENESDGAMLWVWVLGNWGKKYGCEIPYRCLLPQDVEGMLVACRAISMTHDAHNQLRMQNDMQRIGEAAGTAAGLAVKNNVTPRKLDVKLVQAELLETGALGPRRRPELPSPDKAEIHDDYWKQPIAPAKPLAQWALELGSENPQEAVWQIVRGGEDALPLLKKALESDDADTRFWASVTLAAFKQEEAAPELLACLKERRADIPDGHKAVPLWQSSMALLGMTGSRSVVSSISAVLADTDVEMDVLITAVRALGKIGDPAAVPAIEKMLERTDLITERVFQVSTKGGINAVKEDALWQLELISAEALSRLGKARSDLIEKHLADPRAYVRRYADKVEHLTLRP